MIFSTKPLTRTVTSFMAFFMLILTLLFYKESLPDTILSKRASAKRVATGNFAWHHKSEETPFQIDDIFRVYLVRPIKMLYTEPIVALLTLYVAFVYSILYLLLEAIPIIFMEGRGWSAGVSSLPFISIIIGCMIAAGIIIGFNPFYVRMFKANGNRPVPKGRLPPMMIGGILFPIGFFITAWTADIKNGSIFWLAPCIGLCLIGCGILLLFLQPINYLIDVYLMYSASAVAANTVVRSAMAASIPLFAGYMIHGMTVKWSCTFLGLLALVLAPIPFLFWKYDSWLRRSSHFSMNK